MEAKNDILAIFHEVKTDINGHQSVRGTFVVASQMGELIFLWRSYEKFKKDDIEKPLEIKIYCSNVQNIIANFQEPSCYILITAISPSSMYQLLFPPSSPYQIIQFAQIIAIKQQMTESNSIDEAMDFISSSYNGSLISKRLIDLKIKNGRVLFPSFLLFSDLQQNVNVEIMQMNDSIFASNFDIDPDSIMNNRLNVSDLNTIPNLKTLKSLVRDRGLSIDIRYKIWPILCNILPFEEAKQKEILKLRTDEYLSIRNQWETSSKLQIKNFSRLSKFYTVIRNDVNRTFPQESVVSFEKWDEMLTNILRTFTLWNLNVGYTQGLNDLAVNFMGIFLPQVAKNELTIDEVESLSFWCLSSFVELIDGSITAEDLSIAQTKEVNFVSQILNKYHPICYNWLKSHMLSDLLFIRSSLILAYSRSFPFNDVFRIWESIVCSSSPSSSLLFVTASIIIHCFPLIMMETEYSIGRIQQSIEKMIAKQNVGSVISVALAMMDKGEIPLNNDNIKIVDDIVQPDCEFFSLETQNAIQYRNNGDLFV